MKFNNRGISGVMVAVLLTIIGIVAVLIFGGVIMRFVGGRQLRVNIDSAQIIVIGEGNTKLVVGITNVGTADFKVTKITIDGSEVSNCQPEFDYISPGDSVTYTCDCSAEAGKTYMLTVEVQDPSGRKSTVASSVYARRG